MKIQERKNVMPTNKKPIRLIIEDFGPIEKADIELGDFTAIIGPNSSGKTFITNLVDGLMAFVYGTYMFIISNSVFRAVEKIIVKKENKENPISINLSEYPEDAINRIVDDVIEKIKKTRNEQNFGLEEIESQLFRHFQTDPKNLIRFGKDCAKITANFEQMQLKISISHDKGLSVDFLPYRDFLINYIRRFTANFMGRPRFLYGSLFGFKQFRSVLIPTERLSILVTMPNILEDLAKYRGLKNLFPNQPQGPPAQASKQSLIEFMSNYLSAIQSITAHKKEISKNASDLIMGNLTLDFNLPYFINFRLGENNLPINLISSGTLQLIPLVVLAESDLNNALLIEEPEINLHANKQVEVAEYLWKLVEGKNKTVLVSTHSDYFVMKLAHLSKDNKSKTLRVYLLNEGRTRLLNINKSGEIEEIETIGEVLNKLLLEI